MINADNEGTSDINSPGASEHCVTVWKTNINGKISWNLRQYKNGNAYPISDIFMCR